VFNINNAFKMSNFTQVSPDVFLSGSTYYFDSEIDGMQPLFFYGPVPLNEDGTSFITQRVNEQGELVWV
jgi:hypothetical protein